MTLLVIVNILKLAGLLVGSIAGALAALKDTKTADKQLTPTGRLLLVLGLCGFALAFCAQLFEWAKATDEEAASAKKNAATLQEIRRAVTRLDTISLDMGLQVPVKHPAFQPYMQELHSKLSELFETFAQTGEENEGVKVLTSKPDEGPYIFLVSEDGLPDSDKHPIAHGYFYEMEPSFAFFAVPIDLKSFDPGTTRVDLAIRPTSGRPSFRFTLKEGQTLDEINLRIEGKDAPISTWSQSGRILSVEDLKGAQGIVYLRGSKQRDLWDATKINSIVIYANRQRLTATNIRRGKTQYGQVAFTFLITDAPPAPTIATEWPPRSNDPVRLPLPRPMQPGYVDFLRR